MQHMHVNSSPGLPARSQQPGSAPCSRRWAYSREAGATGQTSGVTSSCVIHPAMSLGIRFHPHQQKSTNDTRALWEYWNCATYLRLSQGWTPRCSLQTAQELKEVTQPAHWQCNQELLALRKHMAQAEQGNMCYFRQQTLLCSTAKTPMFHSYVPQQALLCSLPVCDDHVAEYLGGEHAGMQARKQACHVICAHLQSSWHTKGGAPASGHPVAHAMVKLMTPWCGWQQGGGAWVTMDAAAIIAETACCAGRSADFRAHGLRCHCRLGLAMHCQCQRLGCS
jgi:hypothetical protein